LVIAYDNPEADIALIALPSGRTVQLSIKVAIAVGPARRFPPVTNHAAEGH